MLDCHSNFWVYALFRAMIFLKNGLTWFFYQWLLTPHGNGCENCLLSIPLNISLKILIKFAWLHLLPLFCVWLWIRNFKKMLFSFSLFYTSTYFEFPSCSFLDEGLQLVSGSADKSICIWNLVGTEVTIHLQHLLIYILVLML